MAWRQMNSGSSGRRKGKIFCVGWHKTGTTSIGMALRRLGYEVAGWRRDISTALTLNWHDADFEPIIDEAMRFDAFEDWPWPLVFREMDRAFPEAKFILTRRLDTPTWVRSAQAHVARQRRPWAGLFLIYGSNDPSSDAAILAGRYERHNQEVRAHFADRPAKLLELCFECGDGWEDLCAFLGKDVPAEPFPHANKSPDAR
jgi:hypothetical protein